MAYLTVDSCSYKALVGTANLNLGVQADFAISNTTQYLDISVDAGSKCKGHLCLTMAKIIASQVSLAHLSSAPGVSLSSPSKNRVDQLRNRIPSNSTL